MRPTTRTRILAAGVGAALVLSGCTGGPVLEVLEQDQAEQDVLTIRTDLDGIDLATTRFLAEQDGIEYFAARPTAGSASEDTVCLLAEEGIGVGLECASLERGTAGPLMRDTRSTVVLIPDDIDRNALTDDGFALLHPNLAIRPADAG